MNKLIFLLIPVVFALITSCEKDSEINTNEKKITFLETTLGGCHNKEINDLKSIAEDYIDTVEFSIINEDTLNVFIGINYVCCAPFDSETEINNDTLIMIITDTC